MEQTASVAANQPSQFLPHEVSRFHKMCDISYYGVVPHPYRCHVGAALTLMNVDKDDVLGETAKFALECYNKQNRKSFVLVKICKANCCGPNWAMIFEAKEDGTDRYSLFRCVAKGGRVLYCDVKKDGGEIKFVPDDYVGPLPACLRKRPDPTRSDPPSNQS